MPSTACAEARARRTASSPPQTFFGVRRIAAASTLSVVESEGGRHGATVAPQRDDPAGAGEPRVPDERVAVGAQIHEPSTLDDRCAAGKEGCRALVVVGVQRLAPR